VVVVADRPTIVCLCGSTRFMDVFQEVNLRETLAGRIVLSVGCNTKSPDGMSGVVTEVQKAALDELHLRKIDLADEVLFLNVGGYIGSSTHRELAYAIFTHKKIRWLEPVRGELYMEEQAHKLGASVSEFLMEMADKAIAEGRA
jgi:hypothetical protein